MNRPEQQPAGDRMAGADPTPTSQRMNRRLVVDLARVEYGLRQAVHSGQPEHDLVVLAARERMLVAELRDRNMSVHPMNDSSAATS